MTTVRRLRPRQARALGLMLAGHTNRQTALAVGVTDRTVSLWLHHDPTFQAALDAARQGMQAQVTGRLIRLVTASIELLEYEVEEGNVGVARAVLGLLGIADSDSPVR